MRLSAVLKYDIHMYKSIPDVLQKLLQACTKVESALLIESSINRVATEQRWSLLNLFIIVESVDVNGASVDGSESFSICMYPEDRAHLSCC